ncbi:hypothetical protein [Methylobacter sp. YRD-M1]|uniref:hypothetical protein n=1 Tax=Methylobacter sp. YRD-M1 TaxID=2911520 RepID=UPI00227D27D5|nr:hypothetical protein [Methylobacter sp. YRD-M1]WAK00784.1 hypothetical protein LZ558_13120 [Methylobacter sp. YRD-M1]
MNMKQWLQAEYLPISLIALMALTRFHHFGDVLHLPDASLAVFFFAGFYRKKAFFIFLLLLAGLIDYVAISNGTSGWCVSPAYVFLIPAYAVMWVAGRYCSQFKLLNAYELASSIGLMTLAASISFLISNGSFYLLSGRYTDLSWAQYFARVAKYYPLHVGSTMIYGLAIYLIIKLFKSIPDVQATHKEI